MCVVGLCLSVCLCLNPHLEEDFKTHRPQGEVHHNLLQLETKQHICMKTLEIKHVPCFV